MSKKTAEGFFLLCGMRPVSALWSRVTQSFDTFTESISKSKSKCHRSSVTVLMVKLSSADLFPLSLRAALAISSSLHYAALEN